MQSFGSKLGRGGAKGCLLLELAHFEGITIDAIFFLHVIPTKSIMGKYF